MLCEMFGCSGALMAWLLPVALVVAVGFQCVLKRFGVYFKKVCFSC